MHLHLIYCKCWIHLILIVLYSSVLFVGFVYINKTVNIIKELVTLTEEKTNYYIFSNSDSTYTDINSINGLKVGILENGSEDLIEELNEKVQVEYIKYASIGDLIYGLQLEEINVIVISATIYELVLEQNPDFELMVRNIGQIEVVGDPVEINSSIEVGESFILYLSGLDTRDTSYLSQVGLSDVNILMVVNPTTHKLLLVNIPRDYYVPVYL